MAYEVFFFIHFMWLIIKGGLHSLFTLSKGIDDSPFFLGYIFLIELSFCILFSSASHAHPSQVGL